MNSGKWPAGVPKFALEKDVTEQDNELGVAEFRVEFAHGSSMREVRRLWYNASKKFELQLETQLLNWQFDSVRPHLDMHAYIQEWSSHGKAKRSGMEKLSDRLGIPLDPSPYAKN